MDFGAFFSQTLILTDTWTTLRASQRRARCYLRGQTKSLTPRYQHPAPPPPSPFPHYPPAPPTSFHVAELPFAQASHGKCDRASVSIDQAQSSHVLQYTISKAALHVLEASTDARGRRIQVTKIPLPPPQFITQVTLQLAFPAQPSSVTRQSVVP